MFVALTNELMSIDGYFIVVFIFIIIVFVAGYIERLVALPKTTFHHHHFCADYFQSSVCVCICNWKCAGSSVIEIGLVLDTSLYSTSLWLLSKRIKFVYVRFKFHLWDAVVCVCFFFLIFFISNRFSQSLTA